MRAAGHATHGLRTHQQCRRPRRTHRSRLLLQGEQLSQDSRDLFPFFSEDNNPLYQKPSERPVSDEHKKKKREVSVPRKTFF